MALSRSMAEKGVLLRQAMRRAAHHRRVKGETVLSAREASRRLEAQ